MGASCLCPVFFWWCGGGGSGQSDGLSPFFLVWGNHPTVRQQQVHDLAHTHANTDTQHTSAHQRTHTLRTHTHSRRVLAGPNDVALEITDNPSPANSLKSGSSACGQRNQHALARKLWRSQTCSTVSAGGALLAKQAVSDR